METKEMLGNSIVDFMDKQNNGSWHKPEIGKYHASQSWGCLRKQFWSFKDPKPFPREALGRMKVGSLIHSFMQYSVLTGKIKSMEKEIHIPVSRGIEIVGRYDMLGEDENGKYVVDFKSTAFLKKDKVEASDHHKVQMNMYLEGLGIDRGYLMEIQKSDLATAVFEVKKDPELIEKTFNRVIDLDKKLRGNIIPAKDSQADFECKYCQYKERCEQEGDANAS